MEVNDQMIDKLAQLARLEFEPEEKAAIKNDLQRMIDFVHKMDEVNTDHVEPLLHIGTTKNILRKDEVEGSVTTAEALKDAVVNDGTFFKVPKVIKK
jgi:aspartyl-tRNA(Asn)/glutamyl-tRNA(Gln) amidotransferase subunit C